MDFDGLTTWEEYVLRTHVTIWDTDGDGMSDGYEHDHELDPLAATDAGLDPDGDTLPNLAEYGYGTDAQRADTDGDGMRDDWELARGLDPITIAPYFGAPHNPDNDPCDNFSEYVADTDPLNPASYFMIDGVSNVTSGVSIRFWTSAARIYRMERRTNLLDGAWQPFGGSFYGADDWTSMSGTNRSPVFYRVRVSVP